MLADIGLFQMLSGLVANVITCRFWFRQTPLLRTETANQRKSVAKKVLDNLGKHGRDHVLLHLQPWVRRQWAYDQHVLRPKWLAGMEA